MRPYSLFNTATLSLLLVSCTATKEPVEIIDLPRAEATPESLQQAVEAMIAEDDTLEAVKFESVMIMKHGEVLFEHWYGDAAPEKPHAMWSVSKSFTAAAIGMCVDDGLLKVTDKVGKDIIEKGYSVFTEHGLFIYNPFAKLDEVYDGTVFPQYMWSDSLIEAKIDYKGKAEFVYLPDDEQAIRKAVERLGAESIDECAIGIESADIYDDKILEIIEKAINTDGIYAANDLFRKLSEASPEYDKLAAMVEFTDAVHCHDIGVLLDHVNDFGFIEGAATNEAVGRFFVENYDEYQVSMALEDYINYDGFGEQMAEEHEGEFISSGFVYYNGSRCLDDILAQFGEPDSTITMGGM